MTDPKLTGEVEAQITSKQDVIDCLTFVVEDAIEKATSSGNAEQRAHLEESAEELNDSLQILVDKQIDSNTDEFKKYCSDLKLLNTDLQTKLAKLEAIVQKIILVGEIINIIDQVVVVAAGIAGKM